MMITPLEKGYLMDDFPRGIYELINELSNGHHSVLIRDHHDDKITYDY